MVPVDLTTFTADLLQESAVEWFLEYDLLSFSERDGMRI